MNYLVNTMQTHQDFGRTISVIFDAAKYFLVCFCLFIIPVCTTATSRWLLFCDGVKFTSYSCRMKQQLLCSFPPYSTFKSEFYTFCTIMSSQGWQHLEPKEMLNQCYIAPDPQLADGIITGSLRWGALQLQIVPSSDSPPNPQPGKHSSLLDDV